MEFIEKMATAKTAPIKNSGKICIVEDEEDIAELIDYHLKKAGYDTVISHDGGAGLDQIRESKPDLVLLDLMLPGMSGLQICRAVKGNADTQGIPMIMVTAKGSEEDIVNGLEMGADDYVVKPFSPKVLLARIDSVLRRNRKAGVNAKAEISHGGLRIHPGRHEVFNKDEKLDLSATEFRILHFLARRPGWVFTRTQIVNGIRGPNYPVTLRSIDVQIVGLRKKLGELESQIETVRGIGYRFKD